MSIGSRIYNLAVGTFKNVSYLAALALSCILAVLLGYAITQHLAASWSIDSAIDAAAAADAAELARIGSGLVELVSEFHDKAALHPDAAAPAFTHWIETDFRPRLDTLRRAAGAAKGDAAVASALMTAADSVAVMAGSPTSQPARDSARDAVLEADAAVDGLLSAMGIDRRLLEPAPAASLAPAAS